MTKSSVAVRQWDKSRPEGVTLILDDPLGQDRKVTEIVTRAKIVRAHSPLVEHLSVVRHRIVGMPHQLAQFSSLHFFDIGWSEGAMSPEMLDSAMEFGESPSLVHPKVKISSDKFMCRVGDL